MTKQEYKRLSHEIRAEARNRARSKGCSTRAEMHNLLCWCDNLSIDKYGNNLYKYSCVGSYENGLVWQKGTYHPNIYD